MSRSLAPIPRLPVLGWQTWQRGQAAAVPSLLDLPACRFTTSGRASITLALEAMQLPHGSPVLLPTYHCPTMVAPAFGLGAKPRFYPITAQGTPDLAWLDQQDLRGVRVMLAAHFFGIPQPMAAIRQWCDARGIALIEDCAHALMGMADGRPIGSWGDVAIGSLTKFLPVPEGGCIALNRGHELPLLQPCSAMKEAKATLDIIEEGGRHGRLGWLGSALTSLLAVARRLRGSKESGQQSLHVQAPNGEGAAPMFAETTSGVPEGLSALGSAVPRAAHTLSAPVSAEARIAAGLAIDMPLAHRQLQSVCCWMARHLPRPRIARLRREHYQALAKALSGHAGLRPLLPILPDGAVPYVFPLWVDHPDPGYQAMRTAQMPVFRWDRLWPNTPALPGDHGNRWSHHVIQLACHQDLSRSDIDRLVEHALRNFRSS
jgi:perosamine synthetase